MAGTKRAVVLVSGGMDSAVVLAIAREQGFDAYALSVRYGQRHTSELDAADRVSDALGAIEHKSVLAVVDELARDGFKPVLAPVTSDGVIDSLHFIQGGRGGAKLDAPKGLTITGDTLWVREISAPP